MVRDVIFANFLLLDIRVIFIFFFFFFDIVSELNCKLCQGMDHVSDEAEENLPPSLGVGGVV